MAVVTKNFKGRSISIKNPTATAYNYTLNESGSESEQVYELPALTGVKISDKKSITFDESYLVLIQLPDNADAFFLSRGLVDEVSSAEIKCKKVDIGVWNMDSTYTKVVAHGFADHHKIISYHVYIFCDVGGGDIVSELDRLNGESFAAGNYSGGVQGIDPTNIYLFRIVGGSYDTSFYDNAVMNRGYIVFYYFD